MQQNVSHDKDNESCDKTEYYATCSFTANKENIRLLKTLNIFNLWGMRMKTMNLCII